MVTHVPAQRRALRGLALVSVTAGLVLGATQGALSVSASAATPQVGAPHILWTNAGAPPAARANTPTPQEASSDLIFHTGAVEHHPKVYIVYWGAAWQNGFTQTSTTSQLTYTNVQAMTYVNDFFAGMGGTKYNGLQTQYCDNIGSGSTSCAGNAYAHYVTNTRKVLAGVWIDPSPVPAAIVTSGLAEQVTQDPIAQEAMKAATHFNPKAIDPDATVFVYTPPGTTATAYGTVYCAYHNEIANVGGNGLKYAFLPYVPEQGAGCGANYGYRTDDAFGHGYMDPYSEASGHEYAEAVTDPDTFPYQDGWNDASQSENGDKCAYFNVTDLPFGSQMFAVQPLWSNEANGGTGGCAFKRGTGPAPVPPAGYPTV